jgi:hypothetical protein
MPAAAFSSDASRRVQAVLSRAWDPHRIVARNSLLALLPNFWAMACSPKGNYLVQALIASFSPGSAGHAAVVATALASSRAAAAGAMAALAGGLEAEGALAPPLWGALGAAAPPPHAAEAPGAPPPFLNAVQDMHGTRVLQTLFASLSPAQQPMLLALLRALPPGALPLLAANVNASLAVDALLRVAGAGVAAHVADALAPHFLTLARDKFGAMRVQVAIEALPPGAPPRAAMIEAIISDARALTLHPIGNFVVSGALKCASLEEGARFVAALRGCWVEVAANKFGSNVLDLVLAGNAGVAAAGQLEVAEELAGLRPTLALPAGGPLRAALASSPHLDPRLLLPALAYDAFGNFVWQRLLRYSVPPFTSERHEALAAALTRGYAATFEYMAARELRYAKTLLRRVAVDAPHLCAYFDGKPRRCVVLARGGGGGGPRPRRRRRRPSPARPAHPPTETASATTFGLRNARTWQPRRRWRWASPPPSRRRCRGRRRAAAAAVLSYTRPRWRSSMASLNTARPLRCWVHWWTQWTQLARRRRSARGRLRGAAARPAAARRRIPLRRRTSLRCLLSASPARRACAAPTPASPPWLRTACPRRPRAGARTTRCARCRCVLRLCARSGGGRARAAARGARTPRARAAKAGTRRRSKRASPAP